MTSERYQAELERTRSAGGGIVEIRSEDLDASEDGPLPEIRVGNNLEPAIAAADRVLATSGRIFQRGGALVHVARYVPGRERYLKRPAGVPVIQRAAAPHIRAVLSGLARWRRLTAEGKLQSTLPPMPVVSGLLARGSWTVPALDGIAAQPTIRADGTLLETEGYDVESALLVDFGGRRFPSVPSSPSPEDVRAALEELRVPLCDFPFVSPADEAAALGAVLALVARAWVQGPVPLLGVSAPTSGSGKSLLVRCVGTIGTGRRPPDLALPRDSEELRKTLLAVALAGDAFVHLDNVEGPLGTPALASALTSTTLQGRLLGVSQVVTVPWQTCLAATGNGLSFRGDTGRRCIPANLDPQVENPEDRTDFRHDLPDFVEERQARLAVAALTVVRGFVEAGSPRCDGAPTGSFEGWDATARSACVWADLADPAGGRAALRETADVDREEAGAILRAWFDAFGTDAATVHDAMRRAEGDPGIRELLTMLDLKGKGTNPRSIGWRLRSLCGRIVDGLRLQQAGSAQHRILWQVVSSA